jgi:hypothetical protein
MRRCVGSVQDVRSVPGYRYTPELMACFSGGMIAPILGGTLLVINTSFPVYASIGVFMLSGISVLLLSEDAGAALNAKGGKPTLVH